MLKTTEKGFLKLCSKQEQVKAKLIAWGRWNNINMMKSRPTQLFGCFSLSLSKRVIFIQPGMCNRNMDKGKLKHTRLAMLVIVATTIC